MAREGRNRGPLPHFQSLTITSLPAFKQRHARDQPLSTVRSTDSGPRPRPRVERRVSRHEIVRTHQSQRWAGRRQPDSRQSTYSPTPAVPVPFGLLSCWLAPVCGHWTAGAACGGRPETGERSTVHANGACSPCAMRPAVPLTRPCTSVTSTPARCTPTPVSQASQAAARISSHPSASHPKSHLHIPPRSDQCASSAFPRPGRGRRARDMPRSRSPSSASWWKQALTQKTPAPNLAYSVQRRRPSSTS